jgi:cytidine deaminase
MFYKGNVIGSCHAEEDVISKFIQRNQKRLRPSQVTLMVIRTDKEGNILNSKPCTGCKNLIEKYFSTIYYSDQNGQLIMTKVSKIICDRERYIFP